MSLLNEKTLPGVPIELIEEYDTLTFDTTKFGTTESVLVIGTAFDGPVGKEVKIYNPEHAAYIFGETYDTTARREATLTAGIKEAYDNGCRTIYAIRVGGKEISKTFKLRENVDVMLKVAGLFPSNKNKDIYFKLDLESDGEESITFYKPASRATILEKKQGTVESKDSLVVAKISLAQFYGITKDTKLIDFIDFVNNLNTNNIFRFSLVDSNGVEAIGSEEAKGLSVGALFSGVYAIGRVNGTHGTVSSTISHPKKAPYAGFLGGVLETLVSNTLIDSDYPLTNVSNITLETAGELDNIYPKNDIDYEEVNMSSFELYQKLGSGYAKTAMVVNETINGQIKSKVRYTPSSNPNATVQIEDGIYAVAANLKTDYRVLTCGNADEKIKGKLPKVKDFEKISIKNMDVLSVEDKPYIQATVKDQDEVKRQYKFVLKAEDDIVLPDVDTVFTAPLVIGSPSDVEDTKTVVDTKNILSIYNALEPVCTLKQLVDKNLESIFTKIKVTPASGETKELVEITVYSQAFGYTTIEELKEMLEESELGKLFNFKLTANISDRINYVEDVLDLSEKVATSKVQDDKEQGSSEGIYIPYTTTDNFARQLAQHVKYAKIKTYPTHGIIGCKTLVDSSIKSVSQKVKDILDLELDLNVKNYKGQNVLDKNNLPYEIGMDISIPVGQCTIETTDGYSYTSNTACGYAGMVSSLPDNQSSTNQPIKLIPTYTLGETQILNLTSNGYVTYKYEDEKNSYVVVDGVTKANVLSQFSRLFAVRSTKVIDKAIRTAASPFIGKANTEINRNSLQTAIENALNKLLNINIDKWNFSLSYDASTKRFGNIDIYYEVDLTGEIRTISNTVTAKSNI